MAQQKYKSPIEQANSIIDLNEEGIAQEELENQLEDFSLKKWHLTPKEKKAGDIVQDNAFISATPFKSNLADYRAKWGGKSKPYTYIINIPKGAGRGAYLPYYSHFGFTESEFLLNRNNKYKISNIDKDKIYLDLLDDKNSSAI